MRIKIFLIIFIFIFSLPVQSIIAKRQPVGMLFEIKGQIEYSKNGERWKKVRRNKFLYDMYFVKVGENSSVKYLNQIKDETHLINSGSEIQVSKDDIKIIKGSLGNVESSGGLLSGLGKQFKKTQKYTTVRRSVTKEGIHLKLPTNTVSEEFSEVAWENIGENYTYKLHIGIKDRKTRKFNKELSYNISETEKPIVRFKIQPINENKKYVVEVFQKGESIYETKAGNLKVLSRKKLKKFEDRRTRVKSFDESGFLYAGLLKDNGLLLPALDEYNQFFKENSEDEDINELRPFLIEVYSRLRLEQMKMTELKIYEANL